MSVHGPDIEEIKRRLNIVDLIGRYTNLRPSGRNHVGLCPFHQEKSPSFSVNEAKGVFYCFGCQAHGDAFSFLMQMRGLSFPEALEELARLAGVTLSERKVSPEWERQRSRRQQMDRLQALVAEFYHKILLKSSVAEGARNYLKGRGIDMEAIAEYQLGYAPEGWTTLTDFLKKKGYSLELAAEAGLVARKRDWFDLFRNRLLFPISDYRGHIVAFGGRALGPDDKPKYLNSPESIVFKKGQTLYGLPYSVPAMGREGSAIFVEGYMDLLKLWQHGIRNVVAPLGTALTREHLERVQRHARSVVFLFDGDNAGEKAALRAMDIVLETGIPARMVRLEGNLDPDDYIEQYGADRLRERLREAEPLVGYFLRRRWDATPKDAPGVAEFVREALEMIARLRDSFERGLYLKMISEWSNFDEVSLRRQIAGKLVQDSGRRKSEATAAPMRNLVRFPNEEVMVIKLLLHYPRLIRAFRDVKMVDKFSDPLLRRAAAILLEHEEREGGVEEVSAALYADEMLRLHIDRWHIEGPPEGIHEEIADQVLLDALSVVFIRYIEDRVRAKKLAILDGKSADRLGTEQEVMRLLGLREGLRSNRSLELLAKVH